MFDEWAALVEQFSRVTDDLGNPIDTEIFETVVALNALGIPTVRSCGGRLDEAWGLRLPWVDIEVSDPRLPSFLQDESRLARKAKELHQEAKRLHSSGGDAEQVRDLQYQANEMYSSLHAIQREIRVLQAGVRIKLADYLGRFYAGRSVSSDRRLVLSGLGSMRLHNQGAFDCYLLAPWDEQLHRLRMYREEMTDFTIFLRLQYFSRQASLV